MSRRPAVLVVAVQAVVLVALLAGAGAVAGLVWPRLWDPPVGVVQSGRWLTDETGLRAQFAGVGLYVVTAFVAGAVVALLAALVLSRSPLVTLLVLLVGALGAGLLMRHVGLGQGPPDPTALAASRPDGTRLPGDLELPGRGPLVAFPLGAVLAYAVASLVLPERRRDAGEDHPDPAFPPPPAG